MIWYSYYTILYYTILNYEVAAVVQLTYSFAWVCVAYTSASNELVGRCVGLLDDDCVLRLTLLTAV